MRIAVVGGGAAGFFGAIAAATHNPRADIVIMEATAQPLDKVLISGGGRCNVTHHCFDPAQLVKNYPRGFKELRGPFSRFQPRDTVAWFESHGVPLKAEADGRMFPTTNKSKTIIDCLMHNAAEMGVKLWTECAAKRIAIREIDKLSQGFEIEDHNGKVELFDAVLLATGNSPQGHRMAQSLGHTIVPCVPSLFTFKIHDPRLEDLAGVSFDLVAARLVCDDGSRLDNIGPLLITHWGLSGPVILRLSAWGARLLHTHKYRAGLEIDFMPDKKNDQVIQVLTHFRTDHGRKRVGGENSLPLPQRYWERVVRSAGVPEETTWTHLSKEHLTGIVRELKQAHFDISGRGIFKEEFVTCGGVDLREVDFKTMQSRLCPGLYFAGEILDIDGITGGFNFQSAWTTGWLAGLGMASASTKASGPGAP
jgi:predicted Rossmann fold flavoprotein